MKLVTFLKSHNGYNEGASQYYSEEFADELIKKGLVKDAYAPIEVTAEVKEEVDAMTEPEEEEQEEQNKSLDAPVKDKMLRMPRKKK